MKRLTEMNAQEIAEASAQAMWDQDRASQRLGMRIERIAPGQATLLMEITEAMTNGHDNAHGGYIFALADSAFAFACNTYNAVTVGQQASINYVAPGKLGDVLTATAREASRTGRSGVYAVDVTHQNGQHVAHFRGLSRSIKGSYLPE